MEGEVDVEEVAAGNDTINCCDFLLEEAYIYSECADGEISKIVIPSRQEFHKQEEEEMEEVGAAETEEPAAASEEVELPLEIDFSTDLT